MTIARIIKDVLPDRTVASSTAFFALAAETSVETSAETSETRRALASLRTCSVRSLVQPSLAARLLIPVWLMLYWRPISTNESWPARYSRSTASQSINLASGGEQRPNDENLVSFASRDRALRLPSVFTRPARISRQGLRSRGNRLAETSQPIISRSKASQA